MEQPVVVVGRSTEKPLGQGTVIHIGRQARLAVKLLGESGAFLQLTLLVDRFRGLVHQAERVLGQFGRLCRVSGADETGEHLQRPIDARDVGSDLIFIHETGDEDGTVKLSPDDPDAISTGRGAPQLG